MTDRDGKPSPTRPRAWQRMLSGRRLDLLDPDPGSIDIEDIAHGLARVARWNGQTVGDHAFSVAQHALLVEAIASHELWSRIDDEKELRRRQLAALLHDAPEYVVGDLISPFKAAVGLDYKVFELRLLDAIHRRFGLDLWIAPEVGHDIKAADQSAAYHEATRLAGFESGEAERYFGHGQLTCLPKAQLDFLLDPWTTRDAQRRFLTRFEDLMQPTFNRNPDDAG